MSQRTRRPSWAVIVLVQLIFCVAFGVSFARSRSEVEVRMKERLLNRRDYPKLEIPREAPLRIAPLYDEPTLVTDDELFAVLDKIAPRFPAKKLKPNFVEHALRAWGVDATFRDPKIMSGRQMVDFLVNNGQYLASWGDNMNPLLQEEPTGVSIRWGKLEGASVHHDHWLACLTEAGVRRDEPIFVPSQTHKSIDDVLQQAIRDFRVDERETEWSALAYGLWLPPIKSWKNNEGREITFDLMAERQLRGALPLGVCHGTHRIYSLMALVRLDDEFDILSDEMRDRIMKHLAKIRDLIKVSQFPDGHWPSNWSDGADAVKTPKDDELFRQVIATGHHLEWLAIAPKELHPPREQIDRAAKWLIQTAVAQTPESILDKYTFFSHVGNALSLWRKTRPADFYRDWEAKHPEEK